MLRRTFVLVALILACAHASFAAGTKQPILSRTHIGGASGTKYVALQGYMASSANWLSADTIAPWATTGTIKRLVIHLLTAPGGIQTRTFTVRQNGSDTGVTVTFTGSDTDKSDLVDSVSVSPGDVLSVKSVDPGVAAATDVEMAIEFDSTAAGESNYTFDPNGNISGDFIPFQTTGPSAATPIPLISMGGTLAYWRIVLGTAPGTGKSRTFAWIKNGVTQDGTGGTVDTQITISDTATSGTWTGSLSFSQLDLLSVHPTSSGGPAASTYAVGSRVSATDGNSIVCGYGDLLFFNNSTAYQSIGGESGSVWNTTEANFSTIGPYTSTTFSNFTMALSGAATGTWTLDIRKNGSSSGTPTFTISGASTTGSDLSGSVSIGSGDLVNLRAVGSSASQRFSYWCLMETASADTVTSTAVHRRTLDPNGDRAGTRTIQGDE